MNDENLTELLRCEEIKRAKMWNPADRQREILEFLNWAESQLPAPRNSKEGCLAAQRKWLERRK
jgi:hypothetical protein